MDFTFTAPPQTFPEGTSLEAYDAVAWPGNPGFPVGVPPTEAVAVDTQVVSGGQVTFTGLTSGTSYFAYAQVSTDDRYIHFRSIAIQGDKGAILHGADANANRPGFASVEWIGTIEPVGAVDGDTWVDTT